MSRPRLSAAIFLCILAILISLGFWFLARHMPLRSFALFCLLTGAYVVLGLILLKSLSKRIKQNRLLGIAIELVLGAIFVAAFYWFAAYVYPGTR
jgi:hypothetical protein